MLIMLRLLLLLLPLLLALLMLVLGVPHISFGRSSASGS